MAKALQFGEVIRAVRLGKNMTMQELAQEVGITRATLSAIENGSGKCTLDTILALANYLGLKLKLDGFEEYPKRERATRKNTKLENHINRFVVRCVEQYAYSTKQPNYEVFKVFENNGIIQLLIDDYDELHGYSHVYINDWISDVLKARSVQR